MLNNRALSCIESANILCNMDNNDKGDVGLLPIFGVGTLFLFYLVWAAAHDIAHGESDLTLEYFLLVLSIPAFALLYRMAFVVLAPKARTVWLGGTGLLLLLFDLGALNAKLHPKYAPDPFLASLFLMAGIPALGLIGYHLAHEAFCKRQS